MAEVEAAASSPGRGGPAGGAIYRTTPARTARMMAIMLGICIAGGGIFFGMWDYWISQPPPVVALMAGDEGPAVVEVELTGVEIPVDLSFVESEDFRVFSFNAQPGDPGRNPTIEANPGDRIVFSVVNDGISFHSLGVTANEEGTGGIFPESEVGTANSPLSKGESGTSEFVAPEDGIYYYICTVQGHRAQGMEGMIIVGDVDASEIDAAEAAAEKEAPEEAAPAVERVIVEGLEGAISIPEGTSVVGCEATDECYIPAGVSVEPGTTVTWSNDDTAAHTVTSTPDSPMQFDSPLFMPGETFDVTFEEPGEYPYLCIVHPWMTGVVVVKGDSAASMAETEGGGEGDSAASMAETEGGGEGDSAASMAETEGGGGGEGEGGGMDDALAEGDTAAAADTSASSDAPPGTGGDAGGGGDAAAPFDGTISIPVGTSVAGCERTDECYIPSSVTVSAGTTVTWSNDDTAAHTVTSAPDSPMSFDSQLFMPDAAFDVTFEEPGEYPYLCIVHPWMVGTVTVE